MTQEQATSTLAGMSLGAQIQYESSDYVAVGSVTRWAATSADGSLHAGDTVIVFISTGPAATAPSTDPAPAPSTDPAPAPSTDPAPAPSTDPAPAPSTDPAPAPSPDPAPSTDAAAPQADTAGAVS